jgi:alkylation response protein AidB-like acyl-CoA dehydrogenase
MDFDFDDDQRAWRSEVRDFLAEELPLDRSLETLSADETWSLNRQLTRRLAEKRWLGIAWPKEYGGLAAGHIAQMIFNEELGYFRAPDPGGIGIRFIGPALMVLGTEEQKARYLPGIIRGEDVWCQGFSEPGAGSDLASLQTRAVADGDSYIVNGSKIWTSHAHHANYCYLATRTDLEAPKHRGITLISVDMDSPGLTYRPLIDMGDGHVFNQLFFDDVRVPRENVIGEENRGWYAMATTLDFERSGIQGVARSRRDLDEMLAVVRDNKGRFSAPLRRELTDRFIENQIGKQLSYQVVGLQAKGKVPNHEASVTKLFNADTSQRLAATAIRLFGMAGALRTGTLGAALGGRVAGHYMSSTTASIAGGTNEVQRNIIATRGLGLPR